MVLVALGRRASLMELVMFVEISEGKVELQVNCLGGGGLFGGGGGLFGMHIPFSHFVSQVHSSQPQG